MSAPADKQAVRINRLQNLTIVFLTFFTLLLFANLPLFGSLSDRSLLELARDSLRREPETVSSSETGVSPLAFPVRMVYTNDFARLGADALTTLSDEFERAGTYLGEAIGSAGDGTPVEEDVFLAALQGEGLYFDFTVPLPAELLPELLGTDLPEPPFASVRRMLLSPKGNSPALLYLQDGTGRHYRFSTAVSSPALVEFLASRSGNSADFAFLLGDAYARLSPYTLILGDPAPRGMLAVSNILPAEEDAFLRCAQFNAHAENRFTESSGTVIVREVSSALYLRPDGTVDYQGGTAAPDSIYFVPAAEPGSPTLAEAASAAQTMADALLQDFLGDASLYLSSIQRSDDRFEITFDLMSDGMPIRFADGSHAVAVAIEGQSITSYSLRARHYTLTEEPALLLPLAQAAAIARVWNGAELIVAYVDAGGDSAAPAWIAE